MDAKPGPSQRVSRSLAEELTQLMRLGLPIAFVQLGMMTMNVVDVAMLGRHDESALSAMALGNLLTWACTVFCMGAVTAVDPLLAQAVGADDRAAVPVVLGRGALLAIVLSLPAAGLLLLAPWLLELAQQPPQLIAPSGTYAQLQALSILPFLWYSLLRSLLSTHARLWPQVLTIVAGNLANAALDWLLVFGNLGFPELGASGAAITTVSCRWLMLLGLAWFGRADIAPHLRAMRADDVRRRVLRLQPLWRLLVLGTPIGIQFALEMGIFAATGLLIGQLDALAGTGSETGPRLAGHQVAMQLASLSFMVPLGLGMAASVRVGWAVGRQDPGGARRTVRAALVAGGGVMSAFMLLFLLMPQSLASLLVSHDTVIAVAVALIPIAGVFQIVDGLQVVSIGCLRGLGDVRSPVIANVIGFWLVGLPLGAWFAFGHRAGPAGLWWGLVIGLSLVAIGLLIILRLRLSEHRGRLSVD